jgi:hypothetical protein
VPLGNGDNGVHVANAPAGESIVKNLISASVGSGVQFSSSSNNVVQGNFIGTDKSGTRTGAANGKTFGNGANGVSIFQGSNNAIGGTMAGQGNLIAGNSGDGVTIIGSNPDNPVTGNLVQGDFIGTDRLGMTALHHEETPAVCGPGRCTGACVPRAADVPGR